MKQLLQYQPPLTALRVMAAFIVAVLADLIQLPITFILSYFPRLSLLIVAVDSIAMILTIGLVGFNWVLVPCAVLETLPFSRSFPSWTVTVAWAVWQRRNQGSSSQAPETGDDSPDTAAALNPPPREEWTHPSPRSPGKLGRLAFNGLPSGLWVLAAAGFLAGAYYFIKSRGDQPLRQLAPSVFSAPGDGFDFTPDSALHVKPTITVAPVENQVPGKARVHPDRMRSLVEDAIRKIDGVEVRASPPARVRQAVAADFVVFVTLLDLHDEAASFKGYNIAAKTLATRCSLRVQLFNSADRSTPFSAVASGSQTEIRTAAASAPFTNERTLAAIRDALKGVVNNTDFNAVLLNAPQPASTY